MELGLLLVFSIFSVDRHLTFMHTLLHDRHVFLRLYQAHKVICFPLLCLDHFTFCHIEYMNLLDLILMFYHLYLYFLCFHCTVNHNFVFWLCSLYLCPQCVRTLIYLYCWSYDHLGGILNQDYWALCWLRCGVKYDGTTALVIMKNEHTAAQSHEYMGRQVINPLTQMREDRIPWGCKSNYYFLFYYTI